MLTRRHLRPHMAITYTGRRCFIDEQLRAIEMRFKRRRRKRKRDSNIYRLEVVAIHSYWRKSSNGNNKHFTKWALLDCIRFDTILQFRSVIPRFYDILYF